VGYLNENEIQSDKINNEDTRIEFIHLGLNELTKNKLLLAIKKKLTFDPLYIAKFQLYSLLGLIRFRKHIKESDVIFVEGCLIPFANLLSKLSEKRIVLDTHCINKYLAFGYKRRKPLIYIARKYLWDILERFSTNLSDVVIAVSEKEKKIIKKEYKIPESRIYVVPNVIEIPEKKISKADPRRLKKEWGLENKIIATFVGDLESVQNMDAVKYIIKELAPYFWEKMKDVSILIIGRGKEQFKCNLPNVVFTGFIDDIGPFLELTDVCIAPLRVGAGTKTKVLEYMAYGKPAIITPIGAEGIYFCGVDSVKIKKIHEFPRAMLELLDNLEHYKASDGIEIVKKNYSPEVLKSKLKKIMAVLK
jgi:glycosyltransferase involved in cell wall biosynthesis